MFIRQYGSVNQSYLLKVVDEEGLSVTSLLYNTPGIKIVVAKPDGFDEITPVSLASLATPHTDGGVRHVREGVYRVDLPDIYQSDIYDFVLWLYAPDCIGLQETITLLRPAASIGVSPVVPVPSSGQLQVKRGDSYTTSFLGLGNIADRSEIWFTAKTKELAETDETDESAVVQIDEEGLVTVGGENPGTDKASLTVVNAATGDVDIVMDEEVTALFPLENLYFDIQVRRTGGDVKTLTQGRLKVSFDVTRRRT